MTETNVRDFTGNWTGTGTIEGVDDAEKLKLDDTEYMESEVVYTGVRTMQITQNFYDGTGDDVTITYRHADTEGGVADAVYQDYVAPFDSLGYVQIKVTHT